MKKKVLYNLLHFTSLFDRTYKIIALLCFFLLVNFNLSYGQDDINDNFVIASVLIADPGDILYSRVGHACLRMQCPTHHLDLVFSYESESARHKIFSFLAGKLKMGMVGMPTSEYLAAYKDEGRSVKEYQLNMPIGAKRNLWRVLDNHVMEGMLLPYDYLHRGCAHSLLCMLEEGLDTISIHYAPWPEKYKLTRRELTGLQMKNDTWNWCFLNLICNGEIDRKCSPKDKVIMPTDLIEVLTSAQIQGKPIITKKPIILLQNNTHEKTYWITPQLLAIFILLLTTSCFLLKSPIMDYILLLIQSILGIITTYLIFCSTLVCTEWSWLIIPFNPLPLIFWKWRKKWCVYYAIIIALWIITVILWPHTLTDNTYIVIALSILVSYIRMKHSLTR